MKAEEERVLARTETRATMRAEEAEVATLVVEVACTGAQGNDRGDSDHCAEIDKGHVRRSNPKTLCAEEGRQNGDSSVVNLTNAKGRSDRGRG